MLVLGLVFELVLVLELSLVYCVSDVVLGLGFELVLVLELFLFSVLCI